MKLTYMQRKLIETLKKANVSKDTASYCVNGATDDECETMIGYVEGCLEDRETVDESNLLGMSILLTNRRMKAENVEDRFYELNPNLKKDE